MRNGQRVRLLDTRENALVVAHDQEGRTVLVEVPSGCRVTLWDHMVEVIGDSGLMCVSVHGWFTEEEALAITKKIRDEVYARRQERA